MILMGPMELEMGPTIDASNYHKTMNLNLKSNFTDWLISNHLSLDVKKNKCMLFHPYQKDITQVTPQLLLNNDKIEKVESFNFLGVTIDKHLNWKQHTEIIANKLSKYCGIFSKLKNYLPTYYRIPTDKPRKISMIFQCYFKPKIPNFHENYERYKTEKCKTTCYTWSLRTSYDTNLACLFRRLFRESGEYCL